MFLPLDAQTWINFTSSELEAVDWTSTPVVIPLASIEQHRPHLPVGTDYLIQSGMIEMTKSAYHNSLEFLTLPIIPITKANEHLPSAGTLSTRYNVIVEYICDICCNLAESGVQKIFLISSHGGNNAVMDIACREVRCMKNVFVAKSLWSSFGSPEIAPLSKADLEGDYHGGFEETSLILYFSPDSVRMDKLADFELKAHNRCISPIGLPSYGWKAWDLHDAGVAGNAKLASAEYGSMIANHRVSKFQDLMRKLKMLEAGFLQEK